MGWTTNITISNDFFDELEDNPEKLVAAIREGMNDRYLNNRDQLAQRGYVMVHGACHADEPQIIFAQGNASYPIHEFAYGAVLYSGEINKYVRQHLRSAVKQLRWYADALEENLDKTEADDGST